MKHKWVITVGREFCTGGGRAAKMLADALQYKYLDKELVYETADLLSVTQDLVQKEDEKQSDADILTASWYMDEDSPEVSLTDAARVINAQNLVIQKYASEGNCVLVGRCADYTLRNYPYLLRIFFYSAPKLRIQRAMELYQLDKKQAESLVKTTDKQRATYYNRNTCKRKWGHPGSYDLHIDLGKTDAKSAVNQIIKELELRDQQA